MLLNLVPLEIPHGWAVLYNAFSRIEPIIQDGVIVNDQYYQQNLLLISQLKHTDAGWNIDPQGIRFDVGWYPESSPDGAFQLVVLQADWENIIIRLKSKNRDVIAEAINNFMNVVHIGGGDVGIVSFAELLKLRYPDINLITA